MIIGRQVPTSHGKIIDLLAVDGDGVLHAIELKRDRTPREATAQALDYGSWAQTLAHEDVLDLFAQYRPRARPSSNGCAAASIWPATPVIRRGWGAHVGFSCAIRRQSSPCDRRRAAPAGRQKAQIDRVIGSAVSSASCRQAQNLRRSSSNCIMRRSRPRRLSTAARRSEEPEVQLEARGVNEGSRAEAVDDRGQHVVVLYGPEAGRKDVAADGGQVCDLADGVRPVER